MKTSRWLWIPFVALAVLTGLYPVIYLLLDMKSNGLLQSKPAEVIGSSWYLLVFYAHISCGGLALLTGWSQFSERLRLKNIGRHRLIGKIYVLAVLISGVAGLVISFFATGGLVSSLGFGLLALSWIYTDIQAYTAIRKLKIQAHRRWMIRNYALTFAAVTLRIYLPLSTVAMQIAFVPAYRVIAWMCWIPNLVIAEIIISRISKKNIYQTQQAFN